MVLISYGPRQAKMCLRACAKYADTTSCLGQSLIRAFPASILYKSTAGRYRPVSYPDGPITARYRLMKNAYWVCSPWKHSLVSNNPNSGQRMPCLDCTDAQADLDFCCPHIPEDTFSHGTDQKGISVRQYTPQCPLTEPLA